MKRKRLIAFFLVVSLACGMITMSPLVSAAENSYVCDNYFDCTANGEIYIVTKDNAPIRKSPSNSGKVVALAQKHQLIAVKRTFVTIKMSRWAEISIPGAQSLYIHIDNCEPHTKHSFINALVTNKGFVDFCSVCGLSLAVAGQNLATCDAGCVFDQAIKGSFSKYNASFASVVAQIIVGEIPGIGTLADARDVVGDIMTGQPAWVIALDCAALIPLAGMFKYCDELATAAKYADDLSLAVNRGGDILRMSKTVEHIPWGKWSDYTKVTINGREYAKIGDYHYTQHAVSEFLNPSVETNQILKVNPDTGAASRIEHSRGVPPTYVNWVLTEGVDNGTTKVGVPYIENGASRIKYSNGSLDVIVEEGNIVITIITR